MVLGVMWYVLLVLVLLVWGDEVLMLFIVG